MDTPLLVSQVELLRDANAFRELGPVVQAVFREIENYYCQAGANLECSRFRFLTTPAPEAAADFAPGSFLSSDLESEPAPTALPVVEDFWDSARGRYAKTLDHEKLGKAVSQALGAERSQGRALVVTDQELTPPPKFRYLMWSSDPPVASVSLAPFDPRYWGEAEDARRSCRLGTIKQRMRVACLQILGEWVGLKFCEHTCCFMLDAVDSYTRLDELNRLAPEHASDATWLRRVFDLSFPAECEHPERVERLQYRTPSQGMTYA